MLTPEKYLDFHRRYTLAAASSMRARVLAAAEVIGLDRQELAEAANTEGMLAVLKQNADFGSDAKLIATPAYVVNGVAILGHPGLKSLQGVIRSVRSCRQGGLLNSANAGDFRAGRFDAHGRVRGRFNCDHHMMGICVNKRLGINCNGDVAFPEHQIAPAQACKRRQFSERKLLHVAVAGTRDAGCLQ